MRSLWLRTLLVTSLALTLAQGVRAEPLKVVVTIKPVHGLVAAVMQGVGQPRLLIDGAGSPHTFALKPSDARLLSEADVVVRVSDAIEPFTIKLLKSLPSRVRVVTLEATEGLTLYTLRSGEAFEAHDHGKRGHDHTHGRGSAQGATDGHVWLDPANAKLMTIHIARQLAIVAPQHTARLEANAQALVGEIDRLAGELQAALEPLQGRPYIVFHDAYQYLERRYGLTPIGSVTVNPDVPPSARRLSELRRRIAGLKATCVFAEPQFQPKIVETIVEGTRARRGTLDPLGASIAAGPSHYFALMRALANDLRACLGNPA